MIVIGSAAHFTLIEIEKAIVRRVNRRAEAYAEKGTFVEHS